MRTRVDISDLYSVPYRERGRDARTGLDCYGFVMEVYSRMGRRLGDLSYIGGGESAGRQCADGVRSRLSLFEETDSPREDDIITFETEGGVVSHCGIYAGGGRFVHMDAPGVRINSLDCHIYGRWRAWRWLG